VPASDRATIARLLASVAGAVLCAVAASAAPDPRLEPFDPRADYRYELEATGGVVHTV
jgi:hypothetical protein